MTDRSFVDVLLGRFAQVSPPSFVLRIVPLDPTTQPVLPSFVEYDRPEVCRCATWALHPGFASVFRLEDRAVKPHGPARVAIVRERDRPEEHRCATFAWHPGFASVFCLEDRAVRLQDPARVAIVRERDRLEVRRCAA